MALITGRLEYIKGLSEDIKGLDLERKRQSKNLERLSKDNERLSKNLERLSKDNERLSKNLERLSKNLERLSKDNERISKDNERLSKDNERMHCLSRPLNKDVLKTVINKNSFPGFLVVSLGFNLGLGWTVLDNLLGERLSCYRYIKDNYLGKTKKQFFQFLESVSTTNTKENIAQCLDDAGNVEHDFIVSTLGWCTPLLQKARYIEETETADVDAAILLIVNAWQSQQGTAATYEEFLAALEVTTRHGNEQYYDRIKSMLEDEIGTCRYGNELLHVLSRSFTLDGMIKLAVEVLEFSETDMKHMVYAKSLFSDVVTAILEKRLTLYSFLHYLTQAESSSDGTIHASVLSLFEKLSTEEMNNTLEADFLFKVVKEASTLTWMKLLEKLQILSEETPVSTSDAFYQMLCFWSKTKQIQHTCLNILQKCFTASTNGLLSKELFGKFLLMRKENCTVKDERDLLTTYQILELYQDEIDKVVETVPEYLMGRFAVELGMDLMTWEAWIELENRSSRMRTMDRFIKCHNSYKEFESNPELRKALQPMLDNEPPEWQELLHLTSNECWASVEPYLEHLEYTANRSRPERTRHMFQTMLEVMNGRTGNLLDKIADASDVLPQWYAVKVKEIVGRTDEETDSSSEEELVYKSREAKMRNIIPFDKTSEYFAPKDMQVNSTDTTSAPFTEAHLCTHGKVTEDLHKHLEDTNNWEERDYSLFGKKPTNNYKRLRKYLVDSMNASPKDWEPIGIAVIDSGCDEFFIKKRKVNCSIDYKNYINNGGMQDTTGHGTLVTEIIHRYCEFIDVVFYHYIVSYPDGGSCRSDFVDALRTISENDNIHIVNMSLQSDQYTTEYRNILDEVGRKKVVLAASGNDYYGGMRCVYPALHPMVIAVAGDGITFSAPVTEPFVHIRCPSFSCSSHFAPGTSFAVAHATALAAISLRYAEVVDDAPKEQCCAKGLVLFRVLSEMNFSAEHFKAIDDVLGQNNNCYNTQTVKQQLENRCKIFEDILCAINQHNVDYYTASKILSNVAKKNEDDLFEASSSSTAELCWIASEHIHDTTSFKREFSEQQRHFVCQEWSERHGAAPPHQTGYLNHLKDSKFNCYMSNKPAEDMCDAVCNILSTEGFADAADYFKSMIDGPSRRSLLSNSEHMQQFFIDVIKRQQTGTPSQFVFIDSDICAALNMLKRKNYYSKEKPKSWAKRTKTTASQNSPDVRQEVQDTDSTQHEPTSVADALQHRSVQEDVEPERRVNLEDEIQQQIRDDQSALQHVEDAAKPQHLDIDKSSATAKTCCK